MEILTVEEAQKKYIGFRNRKLTILDIFTIPRYHSKSKTYYQQKMAVCQCDCGKIHNFRLSDVINDAVWSCGCLRDEAVKENVKIAQKAYFNKYVYNRRGNSYRDFGNGIIEVDSHANPNQKFYVDASTWNVLKVFTWTISQSNGYAYTCVHYMNFAYHTVIISCPPGWVRDHIDRNRSNNTYQNLRITTPRGNILNQDFHPENNMHGYTGLSHTYQKWYVTIRAADGRTIQESCNSKEEAIKRRQELEQEHHMIEQYVPAPRFTLADGSINPNFRFDWYAPKYKLFWDFLGIPTLPVSQ